MDQILIKLASETQRADYAEKNAKDIAANRDEWKATATTEKARADMLQLADATRREQSASLLSANGYLTTSVSDYKVKTDKLEVESTSLRSRQKWYFGVGAVVGAVVTGFVLKKAN